MPDGYRRLTAETTGQHGAFTTRHAAAAGITGPELRDRIQSGLLEQVGVRTRRSALEPRSAAADVHAIAIDIGAPCWVSGPTAAALHGFDGYSITRPYHLMVPRGRNPRRYGVHVHSSEVIDLIDRAQVRGIPVLSAVRTLIDLARTEHPSRLATSIDSALRDGLISEDLLHRRIVALRSQGRYGIPKLLSVLEGGEITRGGHSWLERQYLSITSAAGLPRPMTQQVISRRGGRFIRVDFHYPAHDVVVEVLGYKWHRSQAQIRADTERANRLTLEGRVCLQFVYRHLIEDPDGMLADVRDALNLGLDRSANNAD